MALAKVRKAKVPVPAGSGPRKQSDRQLTVKAVVRPKIDLQKLAKALVQVGATKLARQRKQVGQTAVAQLVLADFLATDVRMPIEMEIILRYPKIGQLSSYRRSRP